MLRDLILKNRSYRRFDESIAIPMEKLQAWVDLARCTPSAQNKQPLKYILSNNRETNEIIFDTLAWAGALKDWVGPAEGERPSAYIIILRDRQLTNNSGLDPGIAAQSILLGAVEDGFGGCMLGAINRPKLDANLGIVDQYETMIVIALGKPNEIIVLEDAQPGDDITYYRDEQSNHHVPKRTLDELILQSYEQE
jgi:nitroreductase